MKTQIGLGVLSIPAAFDTLGLIPGIIALIVIGVITLWSGYMVGAFKRRHPETYGIEDVGQKIFGRTGREVLGLGFALCGSLPYGNWVLQTFCWGCSANMNSLDVRRRLWYARYFHRFEFFVRTRCLHCYLRGCCLHRGLFPRVHSDSG